MLKSYSYNSIYENKNGNQNFYSSEIISNNKNSKIITNNNGKKTVKIYNNLNFKDNQINFFPDKKNLNNLFHDNIHQSIMLNSNRNKNNYKEISLIYLLIISFFIVCIIMLKIK